MQGRVPGGVSAGGGCGVRRLPRAWLVAAGLARAAQPRSTRVAAVSGARRTRVLHFVTGGFSGGATQVAIALVNAARAEGPIEPLLVLRRKRRTDPARIAELEQAGVPVRVVAGWSHLATIRELVRLCREFRPDVLVAHGFSEHLWGRYAGLLAKVPNLVHVEHNTRERYTRWRIAQTRWLARRTARIVGCSEGVRQVLLQMGMPADRTIAISNGIRLEPFADAESNPLPARAPGIVMVSRLSKQKDHPTLLRAIALLRARGLLPPVLLAGTGKARYRASLEKLAGELGVDGQVQFLGLRRDVPELLLGHRIAVLSTHYEGMPLALIEGMAAGCAVVGSAVPGVREVIRDGVDGLLVAPGDAQALADALERLLRDDGLAASIARQARLRAVEEYGRERMNARYEALFLELARDAGTARPD
ncbi:glycosyltransferase [Luteimonas sp. 100069]|nr:glycosyltransferase [Luteimonas sp. 100069]